MSIGLKIRTGWIYLTKTEKACFNKILAVLKSAKTRDKQLCMEEFQRVAVDYQQTTISHALFLLVCAGILRVEQRSRSRLFSLNPK